MNETRAWTDEQVRRLVGYYLAGEMDAEELATRINGLIIAAGQRRRAEDTSIPQRVNSGRGE